MKKYYRELIFAFILIVIPLSRVFAQEIQTDIMVSINRSVPRPGIKAAIDALERHDLTTGLCFFDATVTNYQDLDKMSAPYYGVAIVRLRENCASNSLQAYLNWLDVEQRKGFYTLYSNPEIGGHPAVSGRN